jgi:AAA domain
VRQRESERQTAAAAIAELRDHRVQVDRQLADAVAAVRTFEAPRDAAPDAVVTQLRAQLDELGRLRERGRTTERRAAELRKTLVGDVRNRLDAVTALGLIEEAPPAAAEQSLEEIACAHTEARKLAGGIDSDGLTAEMAEHEQEIRAIEEELTRIDEELEAIRRAVIAEAMVVATTLTRAYLWPEIQERRFDTVILDEASIAPVPRCGWPPVSRT